MKNNGSYHGKTVSEQWRHQAHVVFSACHSSRTKHRSRILSYSFDLQSCLLKCKRLTCRVCANALEKFAIKFAKNADLDWSKSHEWWCLAIYNSVSKQGRRSFSSLYIVTCCIHIASKVCSNTCAMALQ